MDEECTDGLSYYSVGDHNSSSQVRALIVSSFQSSPETLSGAAGLLRDLLAWPKMHAYDKRPRCNFWGFSRSDSTDLLRSRELRWQVLKRLFAAYVIFADLFAQGARQRWHHVELAGALDVGHGGEAEAQRMEGHSVRTGSRHKRPAARPGDRLNHDAWRSSQSCGADR